VFICAATLGGVDDLLNIFGSEKRKKKHFSRVLKLMKVHSSKFMRMKIFVMLPWYFYKSIVNAFESNPGKGLLANERILIQSLIALILSYTFYIEFGTNIWAPVIGSIDVSFLLVPFIWITLIAMINSVNFSDGLDGLSAGLLLSSFIGFFIISIAQNNFEISVLIATVVGSLITYLYYNIAPARVQFGDVGTYGLGALLTAVAFGLDKALLLPIIGLPFVIEILSTILQSIARRIFGRRLFQMAPLHHHFEMLGWSEEKVVMRFWIFSIISTIIGIWVYFIL
jgi:phospho-N-acetylmuramoyl-pentapeptide-transferase